MARLKRKYLSPSRRPATSKPKTPKPAKETPEETSTAPGPARARKPRLSIEEFEKLMNDTVTKLMANLTFKKEYDAILDEWERDHDSDSMSRYYSNTSLKKKRKDRVCNA